jgi:hypothetical protein
MGSVIDINLETRGGFLMKDADFKIIHISINHTMIPAFFWFLEKGVKKQVKIACDIKTMLSDQLNISADYIDNRIKTMFLNGRPVGDINSTIIDDGAIIALSAAMPGLAGATFRRTENTKPSKSTIDIKRGAKKSKQQKGTITIKFFNLVLRELGPVFLKSGILISKDELMHFLSRQSKKFFNACKSVKVDGHTATIEALKQFDVSDDSDLLMLFIIPD